MKKILTRIFGTLAVNENPALEALMTLANEFKSTPDNWVQLTPYGDFPNSIGMQRIQKEDAQTMANAFASSLRPQTRLFGLPFYIGHPDHPKFADKYRDTKAYGWIKKLEARDDGLFANVKWSEEGKRLIEQESFAGHSVNWAVRKEGAVFRPIALKSVGFTNEPNIPVQPVLAGNEHIPTHMKPLLEWLKKHQIELANEATEAQVAAALGQIDTKISGLETAKTTAETNLANERKTISNLNAQVSGLTTDVANERKARAALLLDTAITEGRITQAERAGYETEFANEFATAETKLKGAKAKLDLRPGFKAKAFSADSRTKLQQITTAINERMDKDKCSYDEAYSRMNSENHPLLVTQQA